MFLTRYFIKGGRQMGKPGCGLRFESRAVLIVTLRSAKVLLDHAETFIIVGETTCFPECFEMSQPCPDGGKYPAGTMSNGVLKYPPCAEGKGSLIN
jgi:hypothetical protein